MHTLLHIIIAGTIDTMLSGPYIYQRSRHTKPMLLITWLRNVSVKKRLNLHEIIYFAIWNNSNKTCASQDNDVIGA